jgi:hypothetical protein
LPGLEAAGEVVRFVAEALDRVFDAFAGFVGVADQSVDYPGNSGGGDTGVLGDIADGGHCSSSLRVPAGAGLLAVGRVTQTVYVNGFVRCRINSKGRSAEGVTV